MKNIALLIFIVFAVSFNIKANHRDTTFVWTGNINIDWNENGNWDLMIAPSVNHDVTIPQNAANYPEIKTSSGGSCHQLIIESGASLNVESGGSLITSGEITNNGTIEISRAILGDRWHMVGVPNNNTTANIFLGDYLQYFNEITQYWIDIINPTTELVPVQGYALYSTSDTAFYTFSGTPNTGNQSYLFTAESDQGLNLISNPYPSSIDWELVIADQENMNAAVYCFDPNLGDDGQYVPFVAGLGDCRFIPPQQGFFISAINAGTFQLTNQHRVHTNSANFYKSKQLPDYALRLDAYQGNKLADKLFFRFNDSASAGFDGKYDAFKILTNSNPQLYIVAMDENLAIDQRPECDEIQLGFNSYDTETYSIALSNYTDFTKIILHDTKTGNNHNLMFAPYEFLWEENDDEFRFILQLKTLESNFFASDTIICEGQSVGFFADTTFVTPDSVVWSFPGGSPDYSTNLNPVILYNEQNFYDVSLTVFWQGNWADTTKSEFIQIIGPPEAPTLPLGDEMICFDEYSSSYTTNSENVTWDLDPSSAGTMNFYDSTCAIIWNENFTGEALLKAKSFNICGESEFSETLTIEKMEEIIPDFLATPTQFVEPPYDVAFSNLTPNSELYDFVWYFGNGDSSIIVQPEYTYPEGGTYTVSLVATEKTTECAGSLILENYIFCSGLGIGDNDEAGFKYFVDRNKNTLELIFDQQPDNLHFNLFDILGIEHRTSSLSQKSTSISLNGLTDGMYVFVIDGKLAGKVIVLR